MSTKQIEVSILGQPYRLACSAETEAALLEAVARVDAEMSKIRSNSSVRGTDRIAVMRPCRSHPNCCDCKRACGTVKHFRRKKSVVQCTR